MNSETLNENSAAVDLGDFDSPSEMAMTDLVTLARRVERLVQVCGQLTQENRELREQNSALQTECAALRDKNEQSRSRIDAMIARLRTMESNS